MYRGRESMEETFVTLGAALPTGLMSDCSICTSTYFWVYVFSRIFCTESTRLMVCTTQFHSERPRSVNRRGAVGEVEEAGETRRANEASITTGKQPNFRDHPVDNDSRKRGRKSSTVIQPRWLIDPRRQRRPLYEILLCHMPSRKGTRKEDDGTTLLFILSFHKLKRRKKQILSIS